MSNIRPDFQLRSWIHQPGPATPRPPDAAPRPASPPGLEALFGMFADPVPLSSDEICEILTQWLDSPAGEVVVVTMDGDRARAANTMLGLLQDGMVVILRTPGPITAKTRYRVELSQRGDQRHLLMTAPAEGRA